MPQPSRLPAAAVKGDRIGVITVSAPEPHQHPDTYVQGIEVLRGRGFEIVEAPGARGAHGYRAGDEKQLLADLYTMLENPTVAAVVCAGGGWNANRLLRHLDAARIAANPKPIVGVSDPTLLLNAITARTGIPTFHGPAVIWDLGNPDAPAHTADHFLSVLAGRPEAARIDAPLAWLRPGRARGHLVAGCLSSLHSLLGTRWEPDWDGAIFAWEDAFKSVEILDQVLTHFRDCGVLDRIAGMVVGEPVAVEPSGGWGLMEMVADVCDGYAFPIATGLPFGHTPTKWTLPIGATVRIDAEAQVPMLIESPWVTPAPSNA
ncbi:S66 peptidase family protein [Streptacidiphilus jiangxiensis]|uniref:Muramoyltetrapeptide carboxypeptidase n=1 Tax=Streptacidiphilus jiangxiensis TaxID=235985 RepID=A0A1H8BHX3_STRJI|nr:LD-carboxypeptidase [Streptacidiphilus jiangxiensis]SEM81507.1 muramoyltetrapeptide carboxypeptidase [Streptacidiphilus jiangxiensis]